jgi:uncharacterized protein (TIGR02996 family)
MSLRHALEDALAANPDDRAAHSAYADLLTESTDPDEQARGEFIQVQLALERPGLADSERQPLQERERDLLHRHGRAWVGAALASFLIDNRSDDLSTYYARGMKQRGKVTFARGWLDTLSLYCLSLPLAKTLADSPALRLLSALEIEHHEFAVGEECNQILARSAHLVNLKSLAFTAEENRGRGGGEGVVDLIARQPRLESLVLMVHGVDVARLFGLRTLTNLERLKVYHLDHYPLETLVTNPAMGRLTHLLLQPHALRPDDESAYLHLDHLRALTSHHCVLDNLTHLALRQSDLGDSGCSLLLRTNLLARLEELDLSRGGITDKGARLLAASPHIHHLKKLDLTNNRLTAAGVAALRATGVTVVPNHQCDPNEEEEFDEGHYLLEGDWE